MSKNETEDTKSRSMVQDAIQLVCNLHNTCLITSDTESIFFEIDGLTVCGCWQ